jgi:hypothetical protein
MGVWTDALRERAHDPRAYFAPFGMLGAMMILASLVTPLIARLGKPTAAGNITPPREAAAVTSQAPA